MEKTEKYMVHQGKPTAIESFKTFPLAEDAYVADISHVTKPSDDAVKEAKDFVDANEK